jgi:very-short-patch-repair endonuclease
MKKLTTEEFIQKAKFIHGSKYDYSKTEYKNSQLKIIIICKVHGEFLQTPNIHLSNHGCKECFDNKKKFSIESFIEKANKVHNYKYDYSKTKYHHSTKKIKINCFPHGEFEQIAANHLRGLGCPQCNSSKGELKIREWLMFNSIQFEEQRIFNNCINKKPLPFDFYLKDFNLCIEFDGIGHYKPTTFGGCSKEKAVINLRLQKEKDSIKTKYCLDNNIKFIRIPYWKINNIDSILRTYLCS